MKRYLVMLALASISLSSLLVAAPTLAAPRERCFQETGYCVTGTILEYWERNGGLPVFGYPITELRTEQVEGQALEVPVQWFQRDRLEDHGTLGIMAARLGASILVEQGTPWETLEPAAETPPGCRYFAETRHTLCEPFLSYWMRNGALERFGYPLSQPQSESVGNWKGTVQYFERRRMEHHTELAGTPYEVQLGLLGRTAQDVAALHGCKRPEAYYEAPLYEPWRAAFTRVSFRDRFICLRAPAEETPASAQLFEGGRMIRVRLGGEQNQIFVIVGNPATENPPYYTFLDDWDDSQPIDSGLTPPPDRYEPQRGFGKVWREHPEIRERLGWAIAREQPGTAISQDSHFGLMLSLPYLDPAMLYALANGDDQVHPGGPLLETVDLRPLR